MQEHTAVPLGDVVVVEAPGTMKAEQMEQVAAELRAAFDGKRVVILHGGLQLSVRHEIEQINRKLDRLIQALSEDEEAPPTEDLDGFNHPISAAKSASL